MDKGSATSWTLRCTAGRTGCGSWRVGGRWLAMVQAQHDRVSWARLLSLRGVLRSVDSSALSSCQLLLDTLPAAPLLSDTAGALQAGTHTMVLQAAALAAPACSLPLRATQQPQREPCR